MENTTAGTTRVPPISFFVLALIIFCLLGSELLVLFLSRIIDGREISQVFSWPVHWYGAIFHWAITILIWGTGIIMIINWLKRRGVYQELIDLEFNRKALIISILSAGPFLAYSYIQIISGYDIPQIYNEYLGFTKMYGDTALVVSLFQNIYYLVEFILVTAIIALFQKAGEVWSKIRIIPWGGIGLILTWGSFHLLSHPEGALGLMIWSLIPGILYVISDKNFYPVYLLLVLNFII